MTFLQAEINDWLQLPITKAYLKGLEEYAKDGRKRLHDCAPLGTTPEEVGLAYKEIAIQIHSYEDAANAQLVFESHDLINEENEDE